jgi:quercetin dioxygenase-like cupin family protein
MASVEVKSVESPDETRPFVDKGRAAVVTVGGQPVLYGTFEPGWRWSEHIKPIAETGSCQAPHLLYCLSGGMHIAMDDGTEAEIGPGDVASIAPGHDAWVVGEEPCIAVDFGGFSKYAQRSN